MKTLIDKINDFENGEETVEKFNAIFLDNKLDGFKPDEVVTIGEPCSPETVRLVTVGNEKIRHDFKFVVGEVPFTEGDVRENTGEWAARKAAGLPFWRDKNGNYAEPKTIYIKGENTIMTDKEMKLKPIQYFLLQYLRGCENSFRSQTEIAEDLNIVVKTVRAQLQQLQELDVISITKPGIHNQSRLKIVVKEDWL